MKYSGVHKSFPKVSLAAITLLVTIIFFGYANAARVNAAETVAIDETNFPDKIFRNYVSENFDTDGDGVLSVDEIQDVTEIFCHESEITDLTGIEHFTKLTALYCNDNMLTQLDVSKNTALTYLSCNRNKLTELSVSKNTALVSLGCTSNKLTALDVSKNTALKQLYCGSNKLTKLDVSKNTALKRVDCEYNQLTELDVSKNVALENLFCEDNQLTSLDVSKNTELEWLSCYSNQITKLTMGDNAALTDLYCRENQITELNVSKSTALKNLYCESNKIIELDVSKNTALINLDCMNNELTELDVSKNVALEELLCGSNKLTELNVSKNTALEWLVCQYNQLTELDVSKNTALTHLNCAANKLTKLDLRNNTVLEEIHCHRNQLTSVEISDKIKVLWMLYCDENQLTALNVSKNTKLKEFYCRDNRYITESDVLYLSDLGINESYVSNLEGAVIENGKLIPTSHLVTYTYDCDGSAGTKTFDPTIQFNHALGEWKADAGGKTHTRACVGGCRVAETANHHFGAWSMTKEPTESATGSRERSCTTCNYTETESIPALKSDAVEKTNLTGTITGHKKITYTSVTAWLEGLEGSIYQADVSKGVLDTQTGKTAYDYKVSAPDGQYSLIVEATTDEGVTVKRTAVVKLKGKPEIKNINLPNGQAKAEVNSEEGATVALVDGLDNLADEFAAAEGVPEGAVFQVEFIVSEPKANDKGKEKISNKAPKNCKLEFMDFTIQKTMFYESGASDDLGMITDTGKNLLSIIIPFDSTDKDVFNIYRYHDDKVDTLSYEPNEDGEYIEVFEDHIIIYAKKFSTYAISYDESAENTENDEDNDESNNNTITEPTDNGESTNRPNEEQQSDNAEQNTANQDNAAETGDDSNMLPWVILMSIAAMIGAAVCINRKKTV